MLLKENWLQELININDIKINDIRLPAINLKNNNKSVRQLFFLGFRYFIVTNLKELLDIYSLILKYKELVFIDINNLDFELFTKEIINEKKILRYVLLQKNISNMNFLDINIKTLLKKNKNIIFIHRNFFNIYEIKTKQKILTMNTTEEISDDYNIFLLKEYDNGKINEIISLNV